MSHAIGTVSRLHDANALGLTGVDGAARHGGKVWEVRIEDVCVKRTVLAVLQDLEEGREVDASLAALLAFDEADDENEANLDFSHFMHFKLYEFLNSIYGLDFQDSYREFDFEKLYTVLVPEDDLKLVRR